MIRDTDRDWTKIAEDNPYWGVLSAEKFRGRELSAENRAEFFKSGEEYIADVLKFVAQHLSKDFKIRRGLDFGCGVGRLLIPLARVSQEAVGIDIAPRMLELTRENLAQEGLTNASVVLGDDAFSRVKGKFNFVNSFIVIQHIPPERGMEIIEHLVRRLEIGGVFALQLTFAKTREFFIHEQGRASYYRRDGDVIHDLLPKKNAPPEGSVRMFDYDLNAVFLLLSPFCGQLLLVTPTNHGGHFGVRIVGVRCH